MRQESSWRIGVDLWRAERDGRAGLRERQAQRLDAMVRHARRHSRYFRHHCRGLPDQGMRLTDLPPVTKADLMAAFDTWVTDARLRRTDLEAFVADPRRVARPYLGEYFVCTSSGTSGTPGLFVYDRRALALYRALAIARIDRHWLRPADTLRLTARRFRWASVVGTGGHYAGAGWIARERARSWWRRSSFRVVSVQRPTCEIVDALNAFDPAILTAYPSALQILAEEQRAGRLRVRPLVVETAGESADPAARARISAAFGVSVHDAYSCSEFLSLAFDCRHGWLHVNSDWAIVEPVERDLGPTPLGRASHTVLLTNLANQVQPIIRYDLGDSVLMRPDPCPCGNPLPAIRVAGRCDDTLRLVDAHGRETAVPPLAIGSAADEVPGVLRCQILQTSPSSLRLRVAPRPGADVALVRSGLELGLRDYLVGMHLPDVTLVLGEEPPEQSPGSGKFRQVIGLPDVA